MTTSPATLNGCRTVTVACFGLSEDTRRVLGQRLAAMPGDLRWDVAAAPDQPAGVTADLVVCTASASRTAVRQWPAASVIALVDARDDGRGVLGALDAGAAACVRGDDLGVVAAFVRSVARRRPALDKDASA